MEPLSGNSVIVIHPGSFYLRIGKASDTFPVAIPHCIARRQSSLGLACSEDSWLKRLETNHSESELQMLQGLNYAQEILFCRPTSSGASRHATPVNQLADYNKLSKGEISQVKSNLHWTNTYSKLPFLIGQQALMVNPSDEYFLRWPIKCGCLNVHEGIGGSLSSVIQDLEDIWSTALCSFLKLSCESFKNLRAVLLISDIYQRQHVRELTALLLERLGFGAVFVIQESVCATFGAGIGSACVVDVGDQKVAISCIEDGLSLPATRVTMQFGGSDITRCFHWLLGRINFPFEDCDLSRRMDALFVQDLKENFCHLDQDKQGFQDQQVLLCRPYQLVVKYLVRMGDERILAPMGVFFPDMFGLKGNNLYKKQEKYYSDPSDPNDDDYLIQTMSRHEQAARQRKRDNTMDSLNVSQDNSLPEDVQMDDDDLLDQSYLLNKSRNDEEAEAVNNVHELIGIHDAVITSIDKCDSDEMKKRMFSNIIVVGGGLMFPGALSWLRHLILIHMPCNIRLSLENLDINIRPKDLDPRMMCWKGGAVMSYLDTSQELWVSQNEWKKHGVRMLRERAPFLW